MAMSELCGDAGAESRRHSPASDNSDARWTVGDSATDRENSSEHPWGDATGPGGVRLQGGTCLKIRGVGVRPALNSRDFEDEGRMAGGGAGIGTIEPTENVSYPRLICTNKKGPVHKPSIPGSNIRWAPKARCKSEGC